MLRAEYTTDCGCAVKKDIKLKLSRSFMVKKKKQQQTMDFHEEENDHL